MFAKQVIGLDGVSPVASKQGASTPALTVFDIEAIRRGAISINPLHLDLTHETMRRRLRDAFTRP